MQKIPFLPAEEIYVRYPLKRYLPLYHPGVISRWLKDNAKPGDAIIDPFASNPLYGIEAASAGYRVFMAQKSPILHLMTEVMAQSVHEDEFKAAVQILLAQEWHGEKIGKYIQDLYKTECRNCRQNIDAEGFVWKKDEPEPTSVLVDCPYCGESEEHPISESDLSRYHEIGNTMIYRSRAIQRCLLEGLNIKKDIEYAISCYTPRALHVLVILFNALDGLLVPDEQRQLIAAVLLEVFDQASSLWHWPYREIHPHQLSTPNVFFEKNIYQAIIQSIRTWTDFNRSCQVTTYPNIPQQTRSICMADRKNINELFSNQTINDSQHLFCVFPRPNQAFWTFSAVWSAWLFGKKAAEGMLIALARQRYGWYWFAQAISATFNSIQTTIKPGTKIFGACIDFTPSYLLAVILGARDAGLEIDGYAFQNDSSHFQFVWQKGIIQKNSTDQERVQSAIKHLHQFLKERAEPVSFRDLFSVYTLSLAIENTLPASFQNIGMDFYNQHINALQEQLSDANTYQRFGKLNIASAKWSLKDRDSVIQPLDDRIENKILATLYQQDSCTFPELYRTLCQHFPGYLTPDKEFCYACLESYTQQADKEQLTYKLRAEENQQKRGNEINEIRSLLNQMGKKLGLNVQDENSICWQDRDGNSLYHFFISTSAVFGPFLDKLQNIENEIPVILFPASRSRLLLSKQRRNPLLENELKKRWHLVKYRHIRKICEQDQLTLPAWQDMLDADPPLWDPPTQLKFL